MVEVLNGSGAPGVATGVAHQLSAVGFAINGLANAASYSHAQSVIEYPPGLEAEAQTLADHVKGPTRITPDSAVPNNVVYFIVGTSFGGVQDD